MLKCFVLLDTIKVTPLNAMGMEYNIVLTRWFLFITQYVQFDVVELGTVLSFPGFHHFLNVFEESTKKGPNVTKWFSLSSLLKPRLGSITTSEISFWFHCIIDKCYNFI